MAAQSQPRVSMSAADTFEGTLCDNVPHGYGSYSWADGSLYEGDWCEGVRTGRGTYTWPSSARYEGEFLAGRMHGQGVFTAPDGTRYEGSWQNDLKHGLGTKYFPNGDQYQGLWREGLPHGPGQYKWANSNEYNGEWASGKMSGRGTFRWASGERYDGEWKDGKEDGKGTFTWVDGSYFDGTWSVGEKHGAGVWAAPPLSADGAVADAEPREAVVREYDHGALVREERVPAQRRPVGDPVAGRRAVKTRRKREVRMGETIYKGAPSYDLMLQLQLGIRWSVSRITPEQPREVGVADYKQGSPQAAVSAQFPREGSATTPPHASHDFKWKDYCPMVFRKLRERFGIDAGDYMLSLCGDMALRELSSPGKSGSVFFLSQDGRFIVKTMRKAEMTLMREAVLRDYYAHVTSQPDTLLTRFFGLHRVKPQGGSNVRFVVMGNLLCTDYTVHRRYDLKGSTFGRITRQPFDPAKKILKDLDLEYTFRLDPGYAKQLTQQLAADCGLLERLRIMDYSMLLGVHFKTKPTNGAAPQGTQIIKSTESGSSNAAADDEADDDEEDDFDGVINTRLGENMNGVAVPGRVLAAPKGTIQPALPDKQCDVILNFGIIDILQEYNMSKQVEHTWKTVIQGQHNISAVNPLEYSHRLQSFMLKVFT